MSKPKKRSQKFETAIYNADYDTIISLAEQHRSKDLNFSFCEPLKEVKESELPKLMQQLLKILYEFIKKSCDENASVHWKDFSPEVCNPIGQLLHATADICLAAIQCDLTEICHLELVKVAVFFNGMILLMPDNMNYVKNFMAYYCEKLFSTGRVEPTEIFISNVLLYLVQKSDKRTAKSDIRRLYAMRTKLAKLINKDGSFAAELWSSFKNCAVSGTFLSILEGQKLVTLLMTSDIAKLVELHQKVMAYVPAMSLKTATAYGKVYYEAWCYLVKKRKKDMRGMFEFSCMKEIIQTGVTSGNWHSLQIIRKILNQFCIHKNDQDIYNMMCSVYQPIILRYLKNPSVSFRASAAQLFLDIFPLEDPIRRVVKNSLEVNEQLLTLRELLIDHFPIVRITAIFGICISISVNWEVFPEEMLKTYFRIMINDLGCDSSTSEVRYAIVKGFRYLLENPFAVSFLVSILPQLGDLFHDVSKEVRIAFCQLLLKVKTISAIKYYEIVPRDHLFARMEEDCDVVKKALTNLVCNSYFPLNEDSNVWVSRCLHLIINYPKAARVFFNYVSNFIGVEISVKFMVKAAKLIHLYIKCKSSSHRLDMEIGDRENSQNYAEIVSAYEASGFTDLNVISGLMEAIGLMFLSLRQNRALTQRPENVGYMQFLVTKLSLPVHEMCHYYKDTAAWESVFFVGGLLPVLNVPSLDSMCFVKLRNLPPNAEESDYLAVVLCLMNHSQTTELIDILKEWIGIGLNNSSMLPPAKKRRGRRKQIEVTYQDPMKSYLANRILNTIIQTKLQKHILKEKEAVKELLYFIDIIKCKLEKVDTRTMSETEADFLNLLVFNIVRLSLLLHSPDDDDIFSSVPFLNDFFKWTLETLLKRIVPAPDSKNHFSLLIFKICKNLCSVAADAAELGYFEPDNCLYLEFIYTLLGTDFGHEYLLIASRFLYKHVTSSRYLIVVAHDTVMMEHHLRYLRKIFIRINNNVKLEKIADCELEEISFTLGNLLLIIHKHIKELRELSSQVFKTILRIILECAAVRCAEIVEKMNLDPFGASSFPLVSRFLWSVITLNKSVNRIYIQYLINMFKDSDAGIAYWIAYWMLIWNALRVKAVSVTVMKDIHKLVALLGKRLQILYPCGKGFEQNNSLKLPECFPLQLFQKHCHLEFIKLKNRVQTKLDFPKQH